MGKLGTNGRAEIDLLSAFVTTIKAGGTMSYHDYATSPAPSPESTARRARLSGSPHA